MNGRDGRISSWGKFLALWFELAVVWSNGRSMDLRQLKLSSRSASVVKKV